MKHVTDTGVSITAGHTEICGFFFFLEGICNSMLPHVCSAQPVALGWLMQPTRTQQGPASSATPQLSPDQKTCSGQPPNSNRLWSILPNGALKCNIVPWLHSKAPLDTVLPPMLLWGFLKYLFIHQCLLNFSVRPLSCLFTSTCHVFIGSSVQHFLTTKSKESRTIKTHYACNFLKHLD